MSGLALAPGMTLWPERFGLAEQQAILEEVMRGVAQAPFYRPAMPRSGTPFSVQMTNFGPLGWVSDQAGYRYQAAHPVTHTPWPTIPQALIALWNEVSGYDAPPEACLVNLYAEGARMGLHQDSDENAADAPVLSVSLGDTAVFRFGGITRKGPARTIRLNSGDVLLFGGPARFMFHGIDRIQAGSSSLLAGLTADGGRINLTLRRVSPQTKGGQSGG